jgi:hypothetical protein
MGITCRRRMLRALNSVFCLAMIHTVSESQICHVSTNNQTIYTIPSVSRPGYLSPVRDSLFRGKLHRVANDDGNSCNPPYGSTCTWKKVARHHYSKDQPWNSDGSLIAIQNSGGTPNRLLLNGNTYAVTTTAPCTNIAFDDWRWHPSTSYPNIQIVIDSNLDKLYWIDATNCTVERQWSFGSHLNIASDDYIGQAEGNVSNDGKYIAIAKQSTKEVFIQEMDPYATGRRGAVYTLPACNLAGLSNCDIGWMSVSPDGKYLVVKYKAGSDADNKENIRVFDINQTTLDIDGPREMASGSYIGCSQDASGTYHDTNKSTYKGWVHPLKHADMMMDGSTAILVGANGCTGSAGEPDKVGHVLRVDLTTGKVWRLSPQKSNPGSSPYSDEQSASHVSCRNYGRSGWAYISYDWSTSTTKRFNGEIVAIKIDSSGSVERFAHTHSDKNPFAPPDEHCYDCEEHAVPSRDGQRVLFASNWYKNCSSCGSSDQPKAYVIDARLTIPGNTNDLHQYSATASSITLKWTAAGDDGTLFGADSYELRRFATDQITESNFSSGTLVSTGTPNYPGYTETAVASSLAPLTWYYFALKTKGTCGTASAISNIVGACTMGTGWPPQFCE